jgi:hypothetical protein
MRSNEIFSSICPSATRPMVCQSVVAAWLRLSACAATSSSMRSRSELANDVSSNSRFSRMWICANASWPRSRYVPADFMRTSRLLATSTTAASSVARMRSWADASTARTIGSLGLMGSQSSATACGRGQPRSIGAIPGVAAPGGGRMSRRCERATRSNAGVARSLANWFR